MAVGICRSLNFFVSVWILQLPDFLTYSKFLWPCRHRVCGGLMTHGSLLRRGPEKPTEGKGKLGAMEVGGVQETQV